MAHDEKEKSEIKIKKMNLNISRLYQLMEN